MLRHVAWAMLGACAVLVLQLSKWFDDGSGLRQLAAMPLLAVAWLVGTGALHAGGSLLVDRALRRRKANAAAVLAADRRPPVLYLRPFDEDLRQARQSSLLRFVPGPSLGLSIEQRITRLLGGLGPLVAIGRPGEALPPLGFARLYASDEDWQDKVLDLLARSAAVVLVAGTSAGLLWELEQVWRRVPRPRIVVIVPGWPAHDHEAFRRHVADRLGVQVPGLAASRRGPFPQDIRALLTFDAAGRAVLHEWDWQAAPAAERGIVKRCLFRGFGGRGIPAYAVLDLLADEHFDRAVAHLLRPAGILPPDAAAARQLADDVGRQKRVVRALALALGAIGLVALAVLAPLL